jgi:hypothetical protein
MIAQKQAEMFVVEVAVFNGATALLQSRPLYVETTMVADISRLQKNIYTEDPNRPLRALIEIDGRELKILPVADSDVDEQRILDALRFILAEWRQ